MSANNLNIDKALLQRIADGDEKAFRLFFDHYRDRFFAVVKKMTYSDDTATELVQQVFVDIWKGRATLAELDSPDSYFFTAVYRLVYKHYKKLALERKFLKVISESPSFQSITEDTILLNETERLVNEAITKLPSQQQLIFKLSRQQGLTREQIAEQLHISPNTVRNHMSDSIKFIRQYLNRAALFYCLTAWLLD